MRRSGAVRSTIPTDSRRVSTKVWGHGSERGIVLPFALLLLLVLGFVATGSVFMSNNESRISSSYSKSNNALAAAEAAVEHGITRLSALIEAGADPDGAVIVSDTLGRFTYTVTAYSKRESEGGGGGDDDDDDDDDEESGGGRDFNLDGDRSDIVRYDRSFGYSDAWASGAPGNAGYPVKLLVAVATDTVSRAAAKVEAEVAKNHAIPGFGGPLLLSTPSTAILSGNFEVNGRLYTRNGALVPSSSLSPAYGNTALSKAAAKSLCNYWKPAVKIPSEGGLTLTGSINAVGHVSFDHGLTGNQNYDAEDPLSKFKFTPEELLGVPPGALDKWKKSVSEVADFSNLSGVNYITSGEVPNQISGSGILIVHNPRYDVKKYDCTRFPTTCNPTYRYDAANQPLKLTINANGSFKGIIITDELIRLNGNFSMYGALASLTTEPMNIPANGSGSLRWSCETIGDGLAHTNREMVRLSWEHGLL